MYSFSFISGSVYAPAASVHASVTCEFTPMHTPGMGSPTPHNTPRHTPASSTTRPVSAKPVTANGAPRLTESSFTVTRMCDGCSVHAGAVAVSDGVYGEGRERDSHQRVHAALQVAELEAAVGRHGHGAGGGGAVQRR